MKMKCEKYIIAQCSTGKNSSIFSHHDQNFRKVNCKIYSIFSAPPHKRDEKDPFFVFKFSCLKNISSFLTSMDKTAAAADKMWKLKEKNKRKNTENFLLFWSFFLIYLKFISHFLWIFVHNFPLLCLTLNVPENVTCKISTSTKTNPSQTLNQNIIFL